MSANTFDLVARIMGDSTDYDKALGKARQGTRAFEREVSRLQRQRAQAMQTVGRTMAIGGAAVLAGVGYAVNAAVKWETAWAGVTKTTSGSKAQMAQLEQGLRHLSRTLPASHEEIAGVAEAAGQLGVSRKDIVAFTKTAIDMGVSTNLSAEEAATAMARFSNVMGVPTSQVGKLGAAVVALGNNGASTEAEILDMAQRISGAGKVTKMSAGDVLGMANALASVGINAEAGGSAISTTIIKIASSVAEGGDKLDKFAQVAGMTSAQYKQYFQKDAAGATSAFITGLGQMQTQGGNVFKTLQDLGLSSIRIRQTLLNASSAGDLFAKSLKQGNAAFQSGTALINEANKRYNTTASRVKIAKNEIDDFAISIGQTFLPVVGKAAGTLGGLADVINSLPGPAKKALGILGGVGGSFSLLGGAALIAVPKVKEFNDALGSMGKRGKAIQGALSKTGSVLAGPWGIALGAGVVLLGHFAAKQAEAAKKTQEYADAIAEDNNALGENSRLLAVNNLQQDGVFEAAKALGISVSDVTDAALGNSDAIKRVNDKMAQYNNLTGNAAGYQDFYGQKIEKVSGAINGENASIRDGIVKAKDKAAAMKGTADQTDRTKVSTDQYTQSVKDEKNATDKAKHAADDLKTALDVLNGANLSSRDAMSAYQEAIDNATASIKANGNAHGFNTKKGRANEAALNDIAKTTQTLIAAQRENGASTDKLSKTMDKGRKALYHAARQMGYTKDEAKKLTDKILGVPDDLKVPTSSPGAKQTKKQIADVKQAMDNLHNKRIAMSIDFAGDASKYVEYRPIRKFGGSGLYKNKPMLATGGAVFGPGTETSDSIPAMLSRNEHVLSAREVRGLGGHSRVEAMRKMAASGQVPAFRAGGRVVPTTAFAQSTNSVEQQAGDYYYYKSSEAVAKAIAAELSKSIGGGGPALQWARQHMAGTPYIWGGVGPHGWDCSGAMSTLLDLIQGRNPYQRRFTTASFGGAGPVAGFVRGKPSWFEVGVTPGSHMVGTLDHHNVESNGGQGFHIDGSRGSRNWGTMWGYTGKTTYGTASKPRKSDKEGRNFANGGVEDHYAQISKPTYRVWAEPETGGEAYIPLAPSKRARSTSVLSNVADRFGMQLVQAQAAQAAQGKQDPTVLELRSGGTKFDDALLEVLRRSIRVKGGNVQVVLGR